MTVDRSENVASSDPSSGGRHVIDDGSLPARLLIRHLAAPSGTCRLRLISVAFISGCTTNLVQLYLAPDCVGYIVHLQFTIVRGSK